jgi:GNAT superfamily N-acetyltransferase
MRKANSPARQPTRSTPPYALRSPQPGDLGWIVQRHGELYASEQGYDMRFEALVARLVGEFVERNLRPTRKPLRERCWIAERDGEKLGCVFVFEKSPRVAKLRMLLVEPGARGMGIGSRLIQECIEFARSAGYRKMTLWTHKTLTAARRLYRAAGFRLVKSAPNPSFGRKLVDEFWELEL